MHGAGIVSLGFLMDAIADHHRRNAIPPVRHFAAGVTSIADDCRWTNGFWDFGNRRHVKWCDLQNTSAHIQLLTDYILAAYRAACR